MQQEMSQCTGHPAAENVIQLCNSLNSLHTYMTGQMLKIKDFYSSQCHIGTTLMLTTKPNLFELFSQNGNCETDN